MLQVKFSECGNWLVSVSRDRCIGLWQRDAVSHKFQKRLIQTIHTRLVYCVGISHDSKFLITGSRDKSIKIFALHPELEGSEMLQELCNKKFRDSVTAVTFARQYLNNSGQDNQYMFWIGLEDGMIECFTFDAQLKAITSLGTLPDNLAHSKKVNRIVAGPQDSEGKTLVASCSDDHTLRLYSYALTN